MRYLVLGVSGLILAGCALPLPVQIASWAASGISYATTGKSVSDHAVSAVVSRDCALHRIALGEDVCFPDEFDDNAVVVAAGEGDEATAAGSQVADTSPAKRLRESMISLAQTLDSDLQPASGPSASSELVDEDGSPIGAAPAAGTAVREHMDNALLALAETLNDVAPAAGPKPRAEIKQDEGKHYLVIGQFRQLAEAEEARSRHAELSPAVRMVLREGALLYQVTAGPFNRPDIKDQLETLAEDGTKAEVALLCADKVTVAPCAGGREAPVQLTERPLR